MTDLHTWGANTNFTLGHQDESLRQNPEIIETLSSVKTISITQVGFMVVMMMMMMMWCDDDDDDDDDDRCDDNDDDDGACGSDGDGGNDGDCDHISDHW